MKILVTGGAGYVGSHVAKALIQAGHEPVVFDNLSKGHREAVKGSFVLGDLMDKESIRQVFHQHEIESVMHFAALSLVGESVTDPGRYFSNNITGGLNLLDAMLESGVKTIVFSSTAAVYGEPQSIPITETDPKLPTNPYGQSKLFFEQIMERYNQAYGLRSISLRYFNAAGADPQGELGEDHSPETHLLPIIFQALLGQRPQITVYGDDYQTPDGTCVRDYIHVTDLASAHLLAMEALAQGAETTAYNLGNGSGFSVLEVIGVVERVTGRRVPWKMGERRPGDPAVLVASSQRIQQDLAWAPELNQLETIVETAWRWHQQHPNGY